MPLKIIGAGFGRTGTLSTFTALNQLGFPCYHMTEVMAEANKSHLDFWRRVANAPAGIQHDWETVFATYTAAVDNPACCVWEELMTAYPDARVLLTLHPKGADAWYESTIDTIYFTERLWPFGVLRLTTPFGRKFGDMTTKLLWQRSHKGTMKNRAKAIAHYEQHIARVKSVVPSERLLVFSVDEGWEPLCRFLDVPTPNTPFPNVNDRAQVKKAIAGMAKGAYIIVTIATAIAVAAVFGAIYLFHHA